MERIAPNNGFSVSQHWDAAHWLNEFVLTVKVKQNGEKWDSLPELNEDYLHKWQSYRRQVLECEAVNVRGDIVQTHYQSAGIVDTAVAKVSRGEDLSLAELSLLEDVHRELTQCKKWRMWY